MRIAILVVSLSTLAFLSGLAVGQARAPAETRGLSQAPLKSLDLQGEVTYHQEGRPESVVRAGDGIAEGKDTTHWAENRGKVAAVWIAVDIPKNP